ncbi:hypothetical protein J2849_000958 [Azospirillum melinis]|nr:hypothetical protein [Azospirillum melinis]
MDLVRLAQFPHLTLQCLDPFLLVRRWAGSFALVTLSLADPVPQCLGIAADLRRN